MFTLILVITLLLIGLVQSILELGSNRKDKSNKKLGKILSYIYSLGFIIAVVIVINQFNDEKKKEQLIRNLTLSVSKIDTSIDIQLNKINNSIEKTNELINLSDSINNKIEEVVEVKDSLIKQYKEINSKFSKQLDYDLKLLIEKAPSISLMDSDLSWIGADSTQYTLKICIRNFGNRNAIVTFLKGKIVLFNSKNEAIATVDMPGSSSENLLEPTEKNGMTACIFSHGINNLKSFSKDFNFAIINVKVKYRDEVLNNAKDQDFYKIWTPKQNEFGGPKDWQINLTKKKLTELN